MATQTRQHQPPAPPIPMLGAGSRGGSWWTKITEPRAYGVVGQATLKWGARGCAIMTFRWVGGSIFWSIYRLNPMFFVFALYCGSLAMEIQKGVAAGHMGTEWAHSTCEVRNSFEQCTPKSHAKFWQNPLADEARSAQDDGSLREGTITICVMRCSWGA